MAVKYPAPGYLQSTSRFRGHQRPRLFVRYVSALVRAPDNLGKGRVIALSEVVGRFGVRRGGLRLEVGDQSLRTSLHQNNDSELESEGLRPIEQELKGWNSTCR